LPSAPGGPVSLLKTKFPRQQRGNFYFRRQLAFKLFSPLFVRTQQSALNAELIKNKSPTPNSAGLFISSKTLLAFAF